MSILSKIAKLEKVTNVKKKEKRVEMTEKQVAQCRNAIKKKNLGYNVQPNRWDIKRPYRVAICYNKEWTNYGSFKSPDVAAAIGSIISVAYFGEAAVAGEFDESKVLDSKEFNKWMEDKRNKEILQRANGELPYIHSSASIGADDDDDEGEEDGINPFMD